MGCPLVVYHDLVIYSSRYIKVVLMLLYIIMVIGNILHFLSIVVEVHRSEANGFLGIFGLRAAHYLFIYFID